MRATQMIMRRRTFLGSVSALGIAGPALGLPPSPAKARPLPLSAVRLKPSIYADAVEANRRYLLSLEPDRLLHNFHTSAGLDPKGDSYGGWEARGIAGHSLGHYLSALSLTFAHTGDPGVRERLGYTLAELARIQAAQGDGYVGGTTVERDGKVVDGKIVFEEIRRGEIRSSGFDVNGGWVPLYTWHKVQAGLIDAHRLVGEPRALPLLRGMADYLATILESLTDEQMQKLLAAEYGGLNEAYGDTYSLTSEPRYLALARRIRDRRVLDPLAEERNVLPGLHANTQIPKLIGLARLHELTGDPADARAARFFHRTVLDRHSYVIGGNSEREHFGEPGKLAGTLTDRTCEACNSYNMLKLTRHLWAWAPDAALFDDYERIHLNHIMAHQHPHTGMFVYFMPLASGARRTYSTPDDSFWCCVGSGMESHAKHGDSIYWEDGETLFVNLFIPSRAEWAEAGLGVELDTRYPLGPTIELKITRAPRRELAVALRLPGWCEAPAVALNGEAAAFERSRGYAVLRRRWRAGDRVSLKLPMAIRQEAMPDDASVVAFLSGPVVLAADLGPAERPLAGPTPALIADAGRPVLEPIDAAQHRYLLKGTQPSAVTLVPFFSQYDRRTAVYFPSFTPEQWAAQEASFRAEQAAQAALEARTVDVVALGEMQPERDHGFRTNHSDVIAFGGRNGRQAWWGVGNWFEVDLAVAGGPMTLRALYWGEEVGKDFTISVGGRPLARERRGGQPEKRFVTRDYAIPAELTRGREQVGVRIETGGSDAPVYELRTLRAAS